MITTERGGIELRTQESLNTIAMQLVELGFIEEYHYTDATIFMDLRRAYEATLGIKWGHINLAMESMGLTSGEAANRYDAIRHELGLRRAARIARIITDAMLEQYSSMSATALNVYRVSFVDLSDALKKVKNNA